MPRFIKPHFSSAEGWGFFVKQWENTVKQYAAINREFFKEFSKFFKP